MVWKLVDIGAVLLALGVLVILGPGVFVGPWRHLRKRFSEPREDG